MAKLLNKNELKELTGYSEQEKIKTVLQKQGIGFVSDKDGKVKTTWVTVDAALASNQSAAMPNFAALDG